MISRYLERQIQKIGPQNGPVGGNASERKYWNGTAAAPVPRHTQPVTCAVVRKYLRTDTIARSSSSDDACPLCHQGPTVLGTDVFGRPGRGSEVKSKLLDEQGLTDRTRIESCLT